MSLALVVMTRIKNFITSRSSTNRRKQRIRWKIGFWGTHLREIPSLSLLESIGCFPFYTNNLRLLHEPSFALQGWRKFRSLWTAINKNSRLSFFPFVCWFLFLCFSIHIKHCLLLWFEFFRTIALLLGAFRDFIAGYSKSSSTSVECRREIFGRTNFHLRVVSLGINVSSTLGDDERRTGEGTEQCRLTERTPRLLDF